MLPRYVIISPCRNEAAFARLTLESVTGQSVPPSLWIIVDDGSTDETPEVVAQYAREFDYIRLIRRPDRGVRSVGPGVVDAFYLGFTTVSRAEFPFFCKLDLDLKLPPRYFETLLKRCSENPRIGTCSGRPYFPDPKSGRLIPETCSSEMSVGPTKFYRMECFEQIGGFVRQVMWDGIDCHRCRMLGWFACSWDDTSDLRFMHLRPMGSSHEGILTGRMRHGFGQYFMGTGLGYLTASAMYRLFDHPVVLGSVALWWGYVRSMIRHAPRYEDPEFRRFLRRYQRLCLVLGKRRTTELINQEMAGVWAAAVQRVESSCGKGHDVPSSAVNGGSLDSASPVDRSFS